MTPAERKAVDKVAERFFPVNGDGRPAQQAGRGGDRSRRRRGKAGEGASSAPSAMSSRRAFDAARVNDARRKGGAEPSRPICQRATDRMRSD
jgi:hypothetical protein